MTGAGRVMIGSAGLSCGDRSLGACGAIVYYFYCPVMTIPMAWDVVGAVGW